jgi:hypothetical protein
VLATVVLAVALLTVYASVNIFDADRFADRATSVLEEPDVREAVSSRVAGEIVRLEPDLIGARPLLETAADAIVGSPAFEQLLRGAVADLHRTFFGREKDTVALTLADVGVLISEAVRAFAPGIAERIPKDVEPTLASISEDRTGILADGAQVAEDVEGAALLSVALALVLMVSAVAVSPDRRRTVGQLSVGVAVVGALGIVAVEVGRAIAAGRLEEAGDRLAVRALWNALFLDLRTWSVVLVVTGTVVAAAARSVLRPVAAADLLRRAWARASATPTTRGGRIAHACVLAVAGGVLIAEPRAIITIATVTLGIGLLYAGLVELLRVALPPQERRTGLPRRGLHVSRRAGIASLVAVAVVGLAVGVAVLANRSDEGADELRSCNGSAALCDRTLADVAFPSTHNSMSSADRRGWLFAQHERGLTAQLDAGVRGLLIDTHYGVETEEGVYTILEQGSTSRLKLGGSLGDRFVETAERLRSRIGYRGGGRRDVYLCHAFCELGAVRATTALSAIRDYLVKHPSEVVVLSVENDIDLEGTRRAFEESGLSDMAWERPVRPGAVPTLREMIEADRRVLVLVWQRGPLGKLQFGEVPWLHRQFDVVQETPYEFKTIRELEARESCRPNEGTTTNPLLLLNHWVDTSPYFLPRNARRVNAYEALLRRARQCMGVRKRFPNLVAVDFFEEGDVVRVAKTLNEEARPPYRASQSAGER